MLFPTGFGSSDTDMDLYFEDQWSWLYSIGAMTVMVIIWHNILITNTPLAEHFQLLILLLAYLVFLVFNIRNKATHIVFLGLQLAGWIIYLVIEESVL